MKIIKLTVVALALFSVASLAFGSLGSMTSQKSSSYHASSIDDPLLFKKWKLSHYELFGSDFDPESSEKNDYVHFHEDNTYTSISEGVFEKGNYELDKQTIVMTSNKEEGTLRLVIKKLTKTTLAVSIDDPNDSDAKYLTIHFKL